MYNPPPEVVPNTLGALSLTELAHDRGLHRPMHERLMDAYWAEARNIGDPAVLRELGRELGFAEDEVAFAIGDDGLTNRVRTSTAQAQSLGVTGVPAFVLDNRLLLLGARPRSVFQEALAQLRQPDETQSP